MSMCCNLRHVLELVLYLLNLRLVSRVYSFTFLSYVFSVVFLQQQFLSELYIAVCNHVADIRSVVVHSDYGVLCTQEAESPTLQQQIEDTKHQQSASY